MNYYSLNDYQKDLLSNIAVDIKKSCENSILQRSVQNILHWRKRHYPSYQQFAKILDEFINREVNVIADVHYTYTAIACLNTAIMAAKASNVEIVDDSLIVHLLDVLNYLESRLLSD